MLSLSEARDAILDGARPGEPISVALTEALGLVLAEPAMADVDLPPFDRARRGGYAVRGVDAWRGARLRVVDAQGFGDGMGLQVHAGEAARVRTGAPMPVGADAVLTMHDARAEPHEGHGRLVEILNGADVGDNVATRGELLEAGDAIAPAGTVVRPSTIPLLASQGCVYPICHRRARVAVVAVGDELVNPVDAPTLNRERSAANLAVLVPCLAWGAAAQDLGAVGSDQADSALDRALNASVVLVLGEHGGAVPRALRRAGVEMLFDGVAMQPGGRIGYGVIRDGQGGVVNHVFHLSARPTEALIGTVLLVGPLVARLHGRDDRLGGLPARLDEGHVAHAERAQVVPVTVRVSADGTLHARPVAHRGPADLPGLAAADALALLAPRAGAWQTGELTEILPLGAPWA
ncbi:molybdopterin biosynthesis enzyme [Isosphaeraceae bacterium EP7]